MSTNSRKKVFVGLSGGVDSSVSAALLKKAGYEVTGVFIRVWNGDAELTRKEERGTDAEQKSCSGFNFFDCTAADDRLDAMRVCATLGIPFRELNLEKEYKRDVVDYMIREYRVGKTPNPDVSCNRFIKFGAFYKWARREGADVVATGHYARIKHDTNTLMAANDTNKDQSYFLWQLKQEQLPHILFPVGGMKKPEVRRIAKKFGLITAEKKDSQGLCFVGKVDMKEFLKHYITPKSGKVLNQKGEVIGTHDGAWFYTIGERLGFKITQPGTQSIEQKAYFVIGKNMRANTLTVSHRSPAGGVMANALQKVRLQHANWISLPQKEKKLCARLRYRQPLQECRVHALVGKTATITFARPQSGVTPGQSLVLYDGDVCLGGGVIA